MEEVSSYQYIKGKNEEGTAVLTGIYYTSRDYARISLSLSRFDF